MINEKRECNTCGGTYSTIQNGMGYYHVCPPIWNESRMTFEDRVDTRNENVKQVKTMVKGKEITTSEIKSEGKGYTKL